MIETLKTQMRLDDGWFQIAGVGRWNQRILAFVCFFASRGYGSEPTVCLDAGEARRDEMRLDAAGMRRQKRGEQNEEATGWKESE